MAISETLRKAVNDKDITAIRSCFYTIVLSDPGFKTQKFDEALNFVKASNVDGVVDVHDGEELLPEEEWNDAYFDFLASKMQDNFSEERIEQLKKVAKGISNSVETKDVQKEPNMNNSHTASRNNDSQNGNNKYNSSSNKSKSLNVNSIEDYTWLGIVGVAIVTLWILGRILKRGK